MDVNEYELTRLREAEHRFRNSLQLLASLTRRTLRDAQSAEAREAISYVSELVDILADMHASLDGRAEEDFTSRFRRAGQRWQRLCNGTVRIIVEAEPALVLTPKEMTIASLIAHELVLNALKHAFPNGRSGEIRLQVQRDGDDHAILTVEDDGIGDATTGNGALPTDAEEPTAEHQGTSLIGALADAIGGTATRTPVEGIGYGVSVRWPSESPVKGDNDE